MQKLFNFRKFLSPLGEQKEKKKRFFFRNSFELSVFRATHRGNDNDKLTITMPISRNTLAGQISRGEVVSEKVAVGKLGRDSYDWFAE